MTLVNIHFPVLIPENDEFRWWIFRFTRNFSLNRMQTECPIRKLEHGQTSHSGLNNCYPLILSYEIFIYYNLRYN